MPYPEVLPKGTRIRIGYHKHLVPEALEVEFITKKDLYLEDALIGEYDKARDVEVLVNPNGWHHENITHRIRLIYDTIIGSPDNKSVKHVLDRLED